MGYTTEFVGKFEITPVLEAKHVAYLIAFNNTRRMKRDVNLITIPDLIREAVNLPYGKDGGYFVGGKGSFGQDKDSSIIEYNYPPEGQPGLWCQWVPTEDGKYLEWDQGEKFYYYTEWLHYLIDNFFQPWGYKLTGAVQWRGEDFSDSGIISINENKTIIMRK